MGVEPTGTNPSNAMSIDALLEEVRFIQRPQKPTDPTLPVSPKSTPVFAPDQTADLSNQDYIGSTIILSPEAQAQAEGIIARLKRDFGPAVDGAGAAASLLALEANGAASTDVLLYVINTVGGGLGDAIRGQLLAGGESYLDTVLFTGSYSPLTNRVYAESPDHQSVYEGLRALGGYEATATLALLPPEAAHEAIQTWAQEDPAGLAASLEELPDENVLDLVRYLKPVVAVRILYQMERSDLIAELALTQPSGLREPTVQAFDELVAQDEIANPERARGAVLAFHNRIAWAYSPSDANQTATPRAPIVQLTPEAAAAQAEVERIVAGGIDPTRADAQLLSGRLVKLLGENVLNLDVSTQTKLIKLLYPGLNPYLDNLDVSSLDADAATPLLTLFRNLGTNWAGTDDIATRMPDDVAQIQSEYRRIANETLVQTLTSMGLDTKTFLVGPLNATPEMRAFVTAFDDNFKLNWNTHATQKYPYLKLNAPLLFREGPFKDNTGLFSVDIGGGTGDVFVTDFALASPLDTISVILHERFHELQIDAVTNLDSNPSSLGYLTWASDKQQGISENRVDYPEDNYADYITRHHESQAFKVQFDFIADFAARNPNLGLVLRDDPVGGTLINLVKWDGPDFWEAYFTKNLNATVRPETVSSVDYWMAVLMTETHIDSGYFQRVFSAYQVFNNDQSYNNLGKLFSALNSAPRSDAVATRFFAELTKMFTASELSLAFHLLSMAAYTDGINAGRPSAEWYQQFTRPMRHDVQNDRDVNRNVQKDVRLRVYSAIYKSNYAYQMANNGGSYPQIRKVDLRNLTDMIFLLKDFAIMGEDYRGIIRGELSRLGGRAKEKLMRFFQEVAEPSLDAIRNGTIDLSPHFAERLYNFVMIDPAAIIPADAEGRGTKRPWQAGFSFIPHSLSQSQLIADAALHDVVSPWPDPAFPVTPESLEFDLHYTDIAIRDVWASLKADPSLPADLRAQIDALPADAGMHQTLAFLDSHQGVPAVANARDSLLDDPLFTRSVATLETNKWGLDVTGNTVVTPDDSVHAGGTRETHYGVDAEGRVYVAAEEVVDSTGRPTQITFRNADGSVNRETVYSYDANGRPASNATTWAETGVTRTETYSYDAAGEETGSTASISRRAGLDGQVQETGFYTYDADQQQISGTERGFSRDGTLLFEVEMGPNGSPAKVIRFEAGVLDGVSLERFHALVQDVRADGNTAFFDHPGVRQLGALLDLAQARGVYHADLKQVDISNLGGAFLGETRLVEVLEGVDALPSGAVDGKGLAGLQSLFVTRVEPPTIGYANAAGDLTQTAFAEKTFQIINGEEKIVSRKVYSRYVPTDILDPNNLSTEKEGAGLASTLFSYDAEGRLTSTSLTYQGETTVNRTYYLGDEEAFKINNAGKIVLPEGATWSPERIEFLQSTLQDIRLGNDPYQTLNAVGQEKTRLIDDVLQQAALYGIKPQDFVNFDPNNLLATEVSQEKFVSFLESLRGVDGVDQAAVSTTLQELAATPDVKTVRLLDYILAPVNILTLGAADDARKIAETLISISKAAGGTILGRSTADVGKEFADDLIRNFDLLGDATRSAKALKVLGPVVGLLFIGLDLYEGITAFKRHKAEGRSDLTLAYDVFLAMGGGPGGAITAAMHMKREHGGDAGENALAFLAGMFGMYDPDNPGSTGEMLARGALGLGTTLESFVKDPIGSLKDYGAAINDLIWAFVPEDPRLQVAYNT